MSTKINITTAEDGFGSEVDFRIASVETEITRQYTLAAEQIAEKWYGADVEVEVDFVPTGNTEAEIETDNETDENEFNGDDFTEAVWQKFCEIARNEFE